MEGFILYSGPPIMYDYASTIDGIIQPSTVQVTNTGLSRFFQRYLLQKAMSVYTWTVPDNWSLNYMLYVLYIYGYVAVVRTDKFGVIPQQCGLKGRDVYYQPTNVIVTNPLLRGIIEPRIDVQCTLLRLQPDYGGIYDIVSYYGDQMALAAQAYGVNILNSKLAYMFMAGSQAEAESYKKAYDKIASGEPMVVVSKKLTTDKAGNVSHIEQVQASDYKNIQGMLQIIKQLEIMFDCAVGIPNVSTTKRERELTSELEANEINTRTLAASWLQELRESCSKTRSMFGVNIDVDWRYQPDESVSDSARYVPVRSDNT